MHISCKLSSTILRYLEDRDEDVSSLLEATEVPEEFLRDPSYWLKVEELEHFLAELLQRTWSTPTSQILTAMAQSCVEQRSWGVLDSVLRMMNSPAEVFTQPERFLSYFIAPAPPVDSLERWESGLAFDLPLSADQYPLVSRFMATSLEMIPVFMGRPPAQCTWDGMRISLSWDVNQASIFQREEAARQLSPVLARDLLTNLQPTITRSYKVRTVELEIHEEVTTANTEAAHSNPVQPISIAELRNQVPTVEAFTPGRPEATTSRKISGARSQPKPVNQGQLVLEADVHPVSSSRPSSQAQPVAANSSNCQASDLDVEHLRHQVARLSDYMARAQQIITLMASAKKVAPEVKEAMRRVDWQVVQTQFPATVEECYQIFRKNEQNQSRAQNQNGNSRPEEPHV